jgi:hypothetical protein
MIDRMDDEEPADLLVPEWFECPVLPPTEMLARIKRHGALDGQSVNLFGALERPQSPG